MPRWRPWLGVSQPEGQNEHKVSILCLIIFAVYLISVYFPVSLLPRGLSSLRLLLSNHRTPTSTYHKHPYAHDAHWTISNSKQIWWFLLAYLSIYRSIVLVVFSPFHPHTLHSFSLLLFYYFPCFIYLYFHMCTHLPCVIMTLFWVSVIFFLLFLSPPLPPLPLSIPAPPVFFLRAPLLRLSALFSPYPS